MKINKSSPTTPQKQFRVAANFMPFIDLGNLEMYYEERGKGIPLLVLPGFGLDRNAMIASFEPVFVKREGWLRIYPDMPGTGKTSIGSSIRSADGWLSLLSSFVKKVIGPAKFTLAGLSYGAYLARGILFHFTHQVLGICLTIPVIIPDRLRRNLPPFLLIERDPSFLASLSGDDRKSFEEIAVIQTQPVWDEYKNIILNSMKGTNWEYLNRLQANSYSFSIDIDEKTPPFSGPSLILTGRQDNICGYRDAWTLLEKFPRATFGVLDGAGHCLDLEQAKLYHALISEWLDRVSLSINSGDAPEKGK